jgi:hypothetical protein
VYRFFNGADFPLWPIARQGNAVYSIIH